MLMVFPLLYRYGTDILFQSIVKLLKKGARLYVKRKTVHLLHMLLNCKYTYMFSHVLGTCSFINLMLSGSWKFVLEPAYCTSLFSMYYLDYHVLIFISFVLPTVSILSYGE